MNSKRIELRHTKSPDGREGEITCAQRDRKPDGSWFPTITISVERYHHQGGSERRHTVYIGLLAVDLERITEELSR